MQNPDLNLINWDSEAVYRNAKYKYIAQRFIRWCDDSKACLSLGNELEWLESLKDQGKSAATIKLYAYAVKAFLIDNLDGSDMTPDEISIAKYKLELGFRSFKMPRSINRKHKERVLSDDEVQLLLSSSREKARAMIEFLASTGCRVSEMINVRKKNIQKLREFEYRIRVMGKGRKERTVLITGGLRKRIYKAYPDTRTYLFESSAGVSYSPQTVHEIVQTAGKRIGVKGLHPHSLRHYFATHMIDKTGDIESVSEYLGHSDVSTTLAMYYHNRKLTIDQLRFNFYGDKGRKIGEPANA